MMNKEENSKIEQVRKRLGLAAGLGNQHLYRVLKANILYTVKVKDGIGCESKQP
jgi:hypothetical protein